MSSLKTPTLFNSAKQSGDMQSAFVLAFVLFVNKLYTLDFFLLVYELNSSNFNIFTFWLT